MPERALSTARRDAAVKALGLDPTDIVGIIIEPRALTVTRIIRDSKGRPKINGDELVLHTEKMPFFDPS